MHQETISQISTPHKVANQATEIQTSTPPRFIRSPLPAVSMGLHHSRIDLRQFFLALFHKELARIHKSLATNCETA